MTEEEIYRAFQSVFEKYYAALCKYSFSIIKEQEASEDLVQEVFMKVWEKNRELILSEGIRFYLFTAVRNNSFNFLKAKRRTPVIPFEQQDYQLTERDTQEYEAQQHNYRQLLEQGIDRLPPRCKDVFLLSRFGKFSYQEIANNLGVSIKTVENQIGKALKILRSVAKVAKLFLLIFLN